MAFKKRGGLREPNELLGLLNNTKLQQTNIAEYQVIQSLISIADQAKIGIAGSRSKDVPIDLSTQVGNMLSPANGGSFSLSYFPDIIDASNITVSDAFYTLYFRVGKLVSVNGKIFITPTAGATLTEFEISLPLSSKFVSSDQLNGICIAHTDSGFPTVMASGIITGNVGLQTANVKFFSLDTGIHDVRFNFDYELL